MAKITFSPLLLPKEKLGEALPGSVGINLECPHCHTKFLIEAGDEIMRYPLDTNSECQKYANHCPACKGIVINFYLQEAG